MSIAKPMYSKKSKIFSSIISEAKKMPVHKAKPKAQESIKVLRQKKTLRG